MMKSEDQNLWNVFNLAERNPDQGGGMMYCIRYTPERIKAHQESVVNALVSMGAQIKDLGRDVGIEFPGKLDESKDRRVSALVEELSCLNEALEYVDVGMGNIKGVEGLGNYLKAHYITLLDNHRHEEAYHFVDIFIPRVVGDLRLADNQNGVLTSKERKELLNLEEFAKRYASLMNRRVSIIG